MDLLQEYGLQAYRIFNTAEPYTRPLRNFVYDAQRQYTPFIMTYMDSAAVWAQDSPSVFSVGALLLFLLIAVQIMNWVRRIMMFWFWLVTRLVFVAVMVVLASIVWERGLGQTANDLFYWGNHLWLVWLGEYKKWEGYNQQALLASQTRQNFARASAKASWRR